MARRDELEKEIRLVRIRLDNAPESTPKDVFEAWQNEYDSLCFELNNLYDDNENSVNN